MIGNPGAIIGNLAPPAPPVAVQLGLFHDVEPKVVKPRRPRPARAPLPPMLRRFRNLLAAMGMARNTQAAYTYQMERLLAAARRHGLAPDAGIVALFQDTRLLGQALVDDQSLESTVLSRWTLAQRRAAVRTFTRLMAPELRPLLDAEPGDVVDAALRGAAERVGCGYRLSGGAPRRRGGPAPTATEVEALIAETARAAGFQAARNRAFFRLLYETGARVNALRELRGHDVHVLPTGRVRLRLHAKSHRHRREVELSRTVGDLLLTYLADFNSAALLDEEPERLSIGVDAPVWRDDWAREWSYEAVRRTFHAACKAAGVQGYTLHSLRRALATDAASVLPRHVVADAGGWQGLQRLDLHYIQPRETTIARKLGYGEADHEQVPQEPQRVDAALAV